MFLFKLSLAIIEAVEDRLLATNTAEVTSSQRPSAPSL
jgi:hypothetical protein